MAPACAAHNPRVAAPSRQYGRGHLTVEITRDQRIEHVSLVAEWWVARSGAGAYDATRFGVVAFSEALRQEITKWRACVSRWSRWIRRDRAGKPRAGEVRQHALRLLSGVESSQAADITDAIQCNVTRPWRVALSEVMIRPTEQEA